MAAIDNNVTAKSKNQGEKYVFQQMDQIRADGI
jgi:hypothetical protein